MFYSASLIALFASLVAGDVPAPAADGRYTISSAGIKAQVFRTKGNRP